MNTSSGFSLRFLFGGQVWLAVFFFGAALLKPVPSALGSTGEALELDLGEFRAVSLEGPFRVTFEEGLPARVIVRGSEAARERVQANISRGTLRLQLQSQGWFRRAVQPSGAMEVTVISPQVDTVAVSGSGRFVAASPLRGERVSASVSGSGRIEGAVEAQSVSTSVSGSGRVQLTGTAPAGVDVRISGSGRADLGAIEAAVVTARISGSGRAEVWALESLDARISGSGRLTYRGTPTVDSRVSGSGSVRPAQ
ncbi:MAG: DUF2807 domain-containing protein [Opitutales bacterium]|nr:DUF2807 domain-containing protein [Opitutales bacterium]